MATKRTRMSEGDVVWWRSWIGTKQNWDELVKIISIPKSYSRNERAIQIERLVNATKQRVREKDLMQATNNEVLVARLTDKYKREVTI